MSHNTLSAYVNNVDGYVGRAMVDELAVFSARHKLDTTLCGSLLPMNTGEAATISKAASKPSVPPPVGGPSILQRSDENFLDQIAACELIVFDLYTADLAELERVLQKLKLVTDHSVLFVLISSVLTWEETDAAATAGPGQPLTAAHFKQRVCSEKYREWQTMEVLVTSLNVKANLRGVVITPGLLYGSGEMPDYNGTNLSLSSAAATAPTASYYPSFSGLMKEAWLRNKDFFQQLVAAGDGGAANFVPTCHVRDAAKVALQAVFFPEDNDPWAPPPRDEDEAGEEGGDEDGAGRPPVSTFDFKAIGKKGVAGSAVLKNKTKAVYVAVDESCGTSGGSVVGGATLRETMNAIWTEFAQPADSSAAMVDAVLTDLLRDPDAEEEAPGAGAAVETTGDEEDGQVEKPAPEVVDAFGVVGGSSGSSGGSFLGTSLNLQLAACPIWDRIPEKHAPTGFLSSTDPSMRKIAKEYCREVNLRPIRGMFASGSAGASDSMIAAASSEYQVELITEESLVTELGQWLAGEVGAQTAEYERLTKEAADAAAAAAEEGEEPPEPEAVDMPELGANATYLSERLAIDGGKFSWKTQAGTETVLNEETGEEEEREVLAEVIPLEEKRKLLLTLLEKKLVTSQARYRGFLLEGIPLTYEEAKGLFATYIPPPEKSDAEEAEAEEDAPPAAVGYYELKEHYPDVFFIASASKAAPDESFLGRYRKPYETQAANQAALAAHEANLAAIRADYEKAVDDAVKAAEAATAEAQAEDENAAAVEPEPVEEPEYPEAPEFANIQYPNSEFFREFGDKIAEVVVDADGGDALLLFKTNFEDKMDPISAVGVGASSTTAAATTGTAGSPSSPADVGGASAAAEEGGEAAGAVGAAAKAEKKIFNFFPTEEELRLAAEKKRKEEEEKLRLEEEERKQLLFEKEEAMLKVANSEQTSRLTAIERQTAEELKNMTAPLKDYMAKFVVPQVAAGLVEVCKVMPEDPVDYLAEYLFTHSQNIPPLPQ